MFIREVRAAAAQALRRPTRLLVALALLLGTAYAAELVATAPSASNRNTSDAICATLALLAGALLLAWAIRRIDALQSLVWRVLHGYVLRRGPPALRLT